MPSNMSILDLNFPVFGKNESVDDKLGRVTSYMYMLVEQLRYALMNVGISNFNSSELAELGTVIREPLTVRLNESDEALSELKVTIEGLSFEVTEGENSTVLSLKSGAASLASASIDFSGLVRFTDLSREGATVINGSNITTGSISALDLSGCRMKCLLKSDGTVSGYLGFYYDYISDLFLAGGIRLDDQGAGADDERKYRMFIYTNTALGKVFHIKIQSAGGVSIEALDNIYIESATTTTLHSKGILQLISDTDIYIKIGEDLWTLRDYIKSVAAG